MNRLLLAILFLLTPVLAHGATYIVAKTGSDGRSCSQAQSSLTPRLTIAAGLACLSGGDTLTIKGGNYSEIISGDAIPSGASDGARTRIQAAPGETVVINGIDIYSRSYITVSGLIFDGYPNHIGRSSSSSMPSTFISFENVTARNWPGGGTGGGGFNLGFRQEGMSSNLRLINCSSHHNGSTSLDHGVYSVSRDNIIDGGSFYNNSGHGIHVFSSAGSGSTNNTVVRNVVAHDNGSFGIGLYSGTNLLAYNNVVYGNGRSISGAGGMRTGFSSNSNKIYNNTVYGNTGDCIKVESNSTNAAVNNNICWKNSINNITDASGAASAKNNLFTDPFFVGSLQFNFALEVDSPAIDKGLTLVEVPNDFNGMPRPQGNSYDIGAFEYSNTQQSTPPSNLRVLGGN